MKSIPLLCNYVIFKSLFINLEDVLKIFIYDITGYILIDINFSINEIPMVRKNEKFKRCDLKIESGNKIFNIELNSCYYEFLIVKYLSYLCSLFSIDTSKG